MALTHLNYPLDETEILKIFERHRHEMKKYVDPRYPDMKSEVQILPVPEAYFTKLFEDLDIAGQPRFYLLKKNDWMPPHIDNGTLCSINFLIGDDEPAPIIIDNQPYVYRQAVLDTQRLHEVRNGTKDRLLFKISIFDRSYEQVVDRIRYKA